MSPGGWALLAAALTGSAVWSLSTGVPRPARPHRGAAVLAVLGSGPLVLAVLGLPLAWVGLAAVAAASTAGARALVGRRRRRAARERRSVEVLEACEVVAAELAAGSPPDRALARAAQVCGVLGEAVSAARMGADVSSALRRASATAGAEDLRVVAAAWHVAHRSGQGLGTTVDRVVARLRAQRRTARVVEAELASARATARLVAVLPAVAWLMGSGAGGSPLTFLLGSPLGLACLAGGLALTLAGLWWIEVLADGVER